MALSVAKEYAKKEQYNLLKSFCDYITLEAFAHSDDIESDIQSHIKKYNKISS